MLVIILLGIVPNKANAEGNVFDCIENEENCEETITPIFEDDKDKDKKTDKNEDQEPEANQSTVGVSAWEYIKVIFALIFVVGLLFALLKFINRKNRTYDKTRLMKNMGGLSLGQHKSVQLIVVAEKYYLIGVGEDIRLLKEITDVEEIERLAEFYEEDIASPHKGLLERLLSKRKATHQSGDTPSDFSNVFNTRLDEMKEDRNRHFNELTKKERDKDE